MAELVTTVAWLEDLQVHDLSRQAVLADLAQRYRKLGGEVRPPAGEERKSRCHCRRL
ncbi:hypothetical protein O7621_23535 [Solwaraspora sp. WMMD937]|uniref:hypothetical protein n=1 Tax=Solwaraspora sp. WMMD937 TaxID=3016090 RepID=UPI00249A2659|nr:hypothetical protein [Solwaraspora sp. WMMD937]WFE20815.1 hypothetical protein O7621_23535 [Solwaraspora sp. WMMD937]